MVLGLSKIFVVMVIVSLAFGYGVENWRSGVALFIVWSILTIIWRFLTR